MSVDTQKLRQCAIESGDGLLRGPALAAADKIDAQAAEIERMRAALQLVSMSAGWQYMAEETREVIRAALSGESNAQG